MNGWQRWWRAPATHPLHRVLFQIHLWLGIIFGVYLLIISISGSAIVLRPQIARWLMQGQAEAIPWPVAAVEWLTRLHDELLLGRPGVKVNGVGGVLFLLMLFSGLLIWWQGSKHWFHGLAVRRASPRSLLWQLHGFIGIWSFVLMFIWGVSAVYFAWPGPFEAVVDMFDTDPEDFERPDGWLRTLVSLHFGRFREHLWLSFFWIVLGLMPAVMYISGFILYLRGRARRAVASDQLPEGLT